HRNLCKSQRLPTFSWQPAAKSANDCSTANSSLPATYNICSGRLATDRAVVVLPRAGKLQRFHRLSTGSGTRVVVLAEPHVFAPEQPPTIPGAVQLRLPSTRTVWNSSGRPCEWWRLARCAACG